MGLRKFIANKTAQHQANVARDRAFNVKLKEKERQGFEESALLAAERKGKMKGRDYGSRDNSFGARLGGSLEAFSVGANQASNTLFGPPSGSMASNIDVFQNPQGFGMPVERRSQVPRMPSKRRQQPQRQASPYDWMNDF